MSSNTETDGRSILDKLEIGRLKTELESTESRCERLKASLKDAQENLQLSKEAFKHEEAERVKLLFELNDEKLEHHNNKLWLILYFLLFLGSTLAATISASR
jgi:SMC interacting uncharacterized protein involved in chromosome segregation